MWEAIDAIGSFGSMVLAGIAGYFAYRLFKVESGRDHEAREQQKRRDDDARRHQASHVSVWTQLDAEDHYSSVYVTNHSVMPIYAVTIKAAGTDPHEFVGDRETVLPGTTFRIDVPPTGLLYAEARFDDNAGIRWSRNIAGTLKELEPGSE